MNPFAKPDRARIDAALARLNTAQRAAAETVDGPLLVLAGAGTGKTSLMVARTAHLLALPGRRARVLAMTFARKAAEEFQTRLRDLLGRIPPEATIGTFHSVAAALLREKPELAGLRPGFRIADEAAARAVLRRAAAGLSLFDGLSDRESGERLAAVAGALSRFKDAGLIPADLTEEARETGDLMEDDAVLAARVYSAYQEGLRAENLADFGDLLLWTARGMRGNADLRSAWGGRWTHVLVDEYQDVNDIQVEWLRLIAAGHGNVCCVGDDDQAIHGFRGSEVKFILGFENDFPGAGLVRLEDNYRCRPPFLAAANAVIANNKWRRGKRLRAAGPEGAPGRDAAAILSVSAAGSAAEAAWVAERLAARLEIETSLGRPPASRFLLYRSNWQSRPVEDALLDRGLTYRLVGDTGFYRREEVRDALAYLILATAGAASAAADPAGGGPIEEAFLRIADRPARGIGRKSADAVLAQVRAGAERGKSFRDVLSEQGGSRHLPRPARAGCLDLAAALDRFATEGLRGVLEAAGYLAMLAADAEGGGERRLANIDELARGLERDAPETVLARGRKDPAATEDDAAIVLMTVHAAKGMEADEVWLVGWEEGLFPTGRTIEAEDAGDGRVMEEERRLAYVALTRARYRLTISRGGRSSRFLEEIPEALLRRVRAGAEPRAPSGKALAYARALLARRGLEEPAGLAGDADLVSDVISVVGED
jgi:DNA helicase-2/ATP-dependent DNA helicase PcrA